MLKELTVKEALQLLAEKHPEPVSGWFWNEDKQIKEFAALETIKPRTYSEYPFEAKLKHLLWKKHFAIEVPDEKRYMTQQEYFDWVVTIGYKGYQVKNKSLENQVWSSPSSPSICSTIKMEDWEYRTVELIDGKVHYGEPQEFKVKV